MMYKTLPPEAPLALPALRAWLVAQRDAQVARYPRPDYIPRLKLNCRGAADKERLLEQHFDTMWDYHPAHYGQMMDVPLKYVHADQHTLDVCNLICLADEIAKPSFVEFHTVIAVKWHDLYWPFDGHHRTWLTMALGVTRMTMKVFDFDAYLRQKCQVLIAS